MKSSFNFVFLFPLLIISCAQKIDQDKNDYMSIYGSTSSKDMYLPCNTFSDETFKGSVWNNSESSGDREACIYLEIDESPKELLRNNDLFLQIYPFFITDDKIDHSSSLLINIIEKTVENDNTEIVKTSEVIDTHTVEAVLHLDPDNFFLDYFFEICGVEEEWKGLELVIYEKRDNQEPPPVRKTKFLLPPFLVHPEYFREENGDALAAYHPFLDLIPELKSQPSVYYDYAEEKCLHIF